MRLLTNLIERLHRKRPLLSELETLILSSVRRELTIDLVALWDKQVEIINKVQRLPAGVEVNFYRMKDGFPSFPAELAFPNRTEELLLAVVVISVIDFSYKLSAKVWCVRGFLFSIEYDSSPKYFEELLGVEEKSASILIECTIAADFV